MHGLASTQSSVNYGFTSKILNGGRDTMGKHQLVVNSKKKKKNYSLKPLKYDIS